MRLRALSSAVVALVCLTHGLAAQGTTGQISGVVKDEQGQGVAAVRITATNKATGATRSTTTNATGAYTLAGLTPGAHTVTAAFIGFKRISRELQVSGDTKLDLTLEVQSLQAVTVTATLREEELIDVPFSIAAPSAQLLRSRGAENVEQVAANVAGFSVQNLGPGQSQVAMRGASSGQIARDQPGVKEQVGSYLDDVPISLSLFTPDMDLFDISRVEVLRGPQGTLFGSGSLAGTVRYIANQPEIGVSSVFGEVGGSLINNGSAGAGIKLGANVPMGDKTALRVAGWYNQLAGWMDAVQPDFSVDENVNTGTRTGIRAAVRFAPNDKLAITPRITYQKVEMDGWNRIDDYNILANPFTTTRPAVTLGPRQLFTQIGEPFTDDYFLGDARIRYSFPGGMDFTSITSYNNRDILVVRDATALTASITGGSSGKPESVYTLDAPLDDATKVNGFTQEVRLEGGAGGAQRLRWLVGGFYSTQDRKYNQSLIVNGYQDATGSNTVGLRAKKDELFFSDLAYNLDQFALFGEATWALGSQLDLTGGLRYYSFNEDRDQVFDGIFAHDSTGTKVVSQPGSTKADGIAPRVIASWRPSDVLTVNAQVAKGFRLGGINDPLNVPLCTPGDLATFSGHDSWIDESAWNYELGTKSSLMNGRGSLNVSAFYLDIQDLQMVLTAGSCSSRLVFNVPKARSAGLEVEFAATPNEHLDFAVSGTFNNSELRSTVTQTNASGQTSVISGLEEGNRLPSVPEVQGAAAATYKWRVGGPASVAYVTGSWNYMGTRYTQIDDLASGFGTVNLNSFAPNSIGGPFTQPTFTFNPEMPAYSLLNLRVGLTRANYDISLYMNNVTDERAFLALDRERGTRARVGYLTNPPRTFGLLVTFQR